MPRKEKFGFQWPPESDLKKLLIRLWIQGTGDRVTKEVETADEG